MSPIGKIFIVVNLALAAAFLGWASNVVATSQEWKTKHDAVVATLDAETDRLESDLSQMRTELTAVREDKDVSVQDRDDQKNRADRAERERDDQVSENQQMRGDLTKIQSSLDALNQHISSTDARLERATDQALASEGQKNDAVVAMRAAEVSLSDSEEARRVSENRAADLEMKLLVANNTAKKLNTDLTRIIAHTGVKLSEIFAQQDIEATIISVRLDPAPGLVSINKGSDDGVRIGSTFEIFHGKTYKGQVKVEIVHPTWSSAVLVRSANGSQMASGDSAATNL